MFSIVLFDCQLEFYFVFNRPSIQLFFIASSLHEATSYVHSYNWKEHDPLSTQIKFIGLRKQMLLSCWSYNKKYIRLFINRTKNIRLFQSKTGRIYRFSCNALKQNDTLKIDQNELTQSSFHVPQPSPSE